jgi:hypothetical protein
MPKISIYINSKDYVDFLAECNSQDMTPEEKIREIITCYVILRRNRKKLPQKILDYYMTIK